MNAELPIDALVDAVHEGGKIRDEALATMLYLFQDESNRKLIPKHVDVLKILLKIIKECVGEESRIIALAALWYFSDDLPVSELLVDKYLPLLTDVMEQGDEQAKVKSIGILANLALVPRNSRKMGTFIVRVKSLIACLIDVLHEDRGNARLYALETLSHMASTVQENKISILDPQYNLIQMLTDIIEKEEPKQDEAVELAGSLKDVLEKTANITWECKYFSNLTIDELYSIMKLRSEVFVVEQNCVYLDMDDNDKDRYHVMGKIGDTVIATTRLFQRGQQYDDYHAIGRVCISGSIRGLGIGKQLMEVSINECERLFGNDGKIKVGAQQYLKKFYESFGFRRCSDGYIEDGIPHFSMSRMYLEKSNPDRVYKIATASQFQQFKETGCMSSELDKNDGFVHLSDHTMAPKVISMFFKESTDVVLIELDASKLVPYGYSHGEQHKTEWIIGTMKDKGPSKDTIEESDVTMHYLLPDGCIHVYTNRKVEDGAIDIGLDFVHALIQAAPCPLVDGSHQFPEWLPSVSEQRNEDSDKVVKQSRKSKHRRKSGEAKEGGRLE